MKEMTTEELLKEIEEKHNIVENNKKKIKKL